jgi:hypothetical protein
VALLQPPEEPVEPTRPPAIIDLTETGRVRRMKESKAASNKRQAEKRRRERLGEIERNKSLSLGEKLKLAKGVSDRGRKGLGIIKPL